MPLPERPDHSDEQLREREIASTYAMLQFYFKENPEGITVSFADEHTAKSDGGDPDRHCYYVGTLKDLGEDVDGKPWALIELERHAIQSVSAESLAPGYTAFLDTIFSPSQSEPVQAEAVSSHISEYLALINEHPALMEDIDLPLPHEPQVFYLEDMPACIIRPLEHPDIQD